MTTELVPVPVSEGQEKLRTAIIKAVKDSAKDVDPIIALAIIAYVTGELTAIQEGDIAEAREVVSKNLTVGFNEALMEEKGTIQ